MTRKDELETLISKNRSAYELGEDCVDDIVYDAWVDELKELDPNSRSICGVGAPVVVTAWKKMNHGDFNMGSLEKVNSPSEMQVWLASPARAYARKVVTAEKLDGISIHLVYQNGVLTNAITRGDGTTGEDIYENVKKMHGVPLELDDNVNVNVRGEIVLKKSNSHHFPELKNLRNTAAGTAKRFDGSGCEHLSVMCYQVDIDKDYESKLVWLHDNGFETPCWTTGDPIEMWQKFGAQRDNKDYDADGLVVTLSDCEHLGVTDGRPKWMVAFKYTAQAKETTIKSIEWSVGSSGRVTPVAQFEPIMLAGAQITNASLYNARRVVELGIGPGARVIVSRAGDVIPKIERVTCASNEVSLPPDSCPKCGMPLWNDGEYIVCKNTSLCDSQVTSRILRWLEGIGVMNVGEKLVAQLVDFGYVRDPSDMYRVTKSQLMSLDRVGDTSSDNFINELKSKTTIRLEDFFGSLCIPNVGKSTFVAWIEAGLTTVEKLMAAQVDALSCVKGVGKKKSQSFVEWRIAGGAAIVERLLKFVTIDASKNDPSELPGYTVCFTGTMSQSRSELELIAKANNWRPVGGVSKDLDFLVVADQNSTSSKLKAAKKLGVKCISEEEFMNLVST